MMVRQKEEEEVIILINSGSFGDGSLRGKGGGEYN